MKRAAILFVVGLLFASASAFECTGVAQCYSSLAACETGSNPISQSGHCTTNFNFFRCSDDTAVKCREVSTGDIVSIRNNDCHQGIRCFSSLSACTSASSSSPSFTSGAFARSACLPNSVFQCREQVGQGICRDVTTGYQIRQGAGAQDPHFKGFDGVTFYFDGEADAVFNLISDTYLQLNAKFMLLDELKGTYMGQLGVLYGNDSLIFDPHFGVILNGSLIVEGTKVLHGGNGAIMVEVLDGRFVMTMQYGAYSLQARVQVENGLRHMAYTNLVVNLVGEPVDPHGILGQTVNPRAGVIDGEEDDYRVFDGLLGTDFTFNRFVADVPAF